MFLSQIIIIYTSEYVYFGTNDKRVYDLPVVAFRNAALTTLLLDPTLQCNTSARSHLPSLSTNLKIYSYIYYKYIISKHILNWAEISGSANKPIFIIEVSMKRSLGVGFQKCLHFNWLPPKGREIHWNFYLTSWFLSELKVRFPISAVYCAACYVHSALLQPWPRVACQVYQRCAKLFFYTSV